MAALFGRRNLEKDGKRAPATVIEVGKRTSWTTGESDNPERYAYETWKVTLRVEPEDEQEFAVQTKIKWPMYQRGDLKVGAAVPVLYDPDDHDAVIYDPSEARGNARTQNDPNTPLAAPAQPTSGAAAPATDSLDRLHRLKELAELRDRGTLTDAEFAAEKAKILGER
jgi:hypothetical protein